MLVTVPTEMDVYVYTEVLKRNIRTMRTNWAKLTVYSRTIPSTKAQLIVKNNDGLSELVSLGEKLKESEVSYQLFLELSSEFTCLLKSFEQLISVSDFRGFKDSYYTESEEFEEFEPYETLD